MLRLKAKSEFFLMIIMLLSACPSRSQDNMVVQNIDLERYAGKWYEIASLSGRFQKGCQCTTSEYNLVIGKYYMQVINRCFRNGKWSEIKGKAFFTPGSTEGKLKVQFFWPFRSDYWIIDLATDYSWAVVRVPDFKYVWILCRKPQMDKTYYNKIILKLRNLGFNSELLHSTSQNC